MGIRIIENEAAKLKAGKYHDRECENCGQKKPAREVESYSLITKGSRGSYVICFGCEGPQIYWERNDIKSPHRMRSPARGL